MRLFVAGGILLYITISVAFSQNRVIQLWPSGTPGLEHQQNTKNGNNVTEVYQPDLTVFLPMKSDTNHPAVLVFPGGGYRQIVIEKEGYTIARWLNNNGIAAFVLTYRLNNDIALQDAQRALSLVRSRAKEFGINSDNVGVMGFSAGAHLSVHVATHQMKSVLNDWVDSISCRPNFMVLVYGTYDAFINRINNDTPPAFIVHAGDDDRVSVSQSINLYTSLRAHGVPAEMHIYEKGGHGFALLEDRGPVISWAQRCIDWMKLRGIISAW
jgi:acetyl esterase/lipase